MTEKNIDTKEFAKKESGKKLSGAQKIRLYIEKIDIGNTITMSNLIEATALSKNYLGIQIRKLMMEGCLKKVKAGAWKIIEKPFTADSDYKNRTIKNHKSSKYVPRFSGQGKNKRTWGGTIDD